MEPDGTSFVELKETKTKIWTTQQPCLFPETMTRLLKILHAPCWQHKEFNLMEPDGTSLVKLKETREDILKTQQLRLFPEIMTRWLEVRHTPCWP